MGERSESIQLPTTDYRLQTTYATQLTIKGTPHSGQTPLHLPPNHQPTPTSLCRRLRRPYHLQVLIRPDAAVHTLTLAKHTKTKRCLPSSLLSPSPPSFPTHLPKVVLKLLHSPRNGSTTLLSCVVDPLTPLPLLSPLRLPSPPLPALPGRHWHW